jgi:hypothetical protein
MDPNLGTRTMDEVAADKKTYATAYVLAEDAERLLVRALRILNELDPRGRDTWELNAVVEKLQEWNPIAG